MTLLLQKISHDNRQKEAPCGVKNAQSFLVIAIANDQNLC